MGIVIRVAGVLALVLAGGLLALSGVPPFPALLSFKQTLSEQGHRQALLKRLEALGYREARGDFAGRPDSFLLRVSRRPDAPLLLDLHPWNNHWLELREPLFVRFAALDWHVVRPDFGGPVRRSGHCCSAAVIAAIDRALALAHAAGVPGQAPLLVLGESGGGMTAACWLARGQGRPRQVQLWGAIADLPLWARQSVVAQPAIAADVQQCSGTALPSPVVLDYRDKLPGTRIEILAGIHDGFAGTVPPTHSLSLFHHLARQGGGTDLTQAAASDDILLRRLLVERVGDGGAYPPLAPGRPVHLRRQAGSVTLTLFEGGHELLPETVLALFCQEDHRGCAVQP